jgi:hypothetical protein
VIASACLQADATSTLRGMSDETRSPGIVRRLLRGGHDPREAQRKSVESRKARKAARERAAELAALERENEAARTVDVDVTPKRRPFQSWLAYYDEQARSSRVDVHERAPRPWQGRPRTSARMPSPDLPDERLTPREFDARHGFRAARKLKRSSRWWDRKAESSRAPLSPSQLRGEHVDF